MRTEKCQPDSSMGGEREDTRIFEGEIRNRAHTVLLLATKFTEDGKTRLTQSMLESLGDNFNA